MILIKNFTVKTLVLNCNCTYIVVWKIVYARQHLREYSSSLKVESVYTHYIYIYIYLYTTCIYTSSTFKQMLRFKSYAHTVTMSSVMLW